MYLKLDSLQPSGSFKDRGMAHLCETLKKQGAKRLISSSGECPTRPRRLQDVRDNDRTLGDLCLG